MGMETGDYKSVRFLTERVCSAVIKLRETTLPRLVCSAHFEIGPLIEKILSTNTLFCLLCDVTFVSSVYG
jgi:hypothetical protein